MSAGRLIALLALAGCSQESLSSREADVPCFSAGECATGFVCLEAQCVRNDSTGPSEVYGEVDPPDGTPYVRTQELDPQVIGGTYTFNLLNAAEYEVKVLKDQQPVGARVTFFGRGRIPLREDDLTRTFNSGTGIVRLQPSTYDVRISLNDRSLPGFETRGFAASDRGTRETKEFTVPSRYRVLEGVVVNAVATSSVFQGVVVEAVGKQSGLPSTEALTGPDGRYSILLPDTAETQFVLSARVANPIEATWSFEEEVRVDSQSRVKDIELEPADDTRSGTVRLRIVGLGGPEPEGVPNANVTLTASTTTGLESRRYTVSGVTDAAGFVTLPFLDELYRIEVQTPQQSPFASKTVERELVSVLSSIDDELTLNLRTQIFGTVLSASGNAVADALLELLPLEARGRTFDAETGIDGGFVAEVDPGRYLIVIRPPQSQGGELLPIHTVVQTISPNDLELSPFRLPVGTEVFGAVRGAVSGGTITVARARVEFFIFQENQTISIARTFSDSGGSYSVVLPNPPN